VLLGFRNKEVATVRGCPPFGFFDGRVAQFGAMLHGRTVLAQILDGLDPKEVARCAAMYPMVRDTPALSAYEHFAVLVFA
jgi:hypothetical protein